jgi:hypothetical protein
MCGARRGAPAARRPALAPLASVGAGSSSCKAWSAPDRRRLLLLLLLLLLARTLPVLSLCSAELLRRRHLR